MPIPCLAQNDATLSFHREYMKPARQDLSRRIQLFIDRTEIKANIEVSHIAKNIDEFLGTVSDFDVMTGLENYICASVYTVCYKACVVNCKIQEFRFRSRISALNCSEFNESLAISKFHGERFTKMVKACGMCI